jgi:predicted transposase/invertase (TIGR01784 family)
METDAFFCQLFKQMPQTIFELLGFPPERARAYRFDSIEVKKSFRIDGLFLPRKASLPLVFVEVQFRKSPTFYANLFAKVFCYLEENDPGQEWLAVAVFASRRVEPGEAGPYQDLLRSRRVRRIYLDSHPMPADPPVGLGILQLVTAPADQARELVVSLLHKANTEFADTEMALKAVELVEELLVRRFPKLSREEIRAMFELEDLRKTRVWQEAREEGEEQGLQQGLQRGLQQGQLLTKKELVRKWLAKGMPVKEIAGLLEVSAQEVRRLAKDGTH